MVDPESQNPYAGRRTRSQCTEPFLFMYVLNVIMSSFKRLYPESDMFFQSEDTVVYLIHLAGKIGRCQHYLGSTDDLDRRLKQHRKKRPYYTLTACSFKPLTGTIPEDMMTELRAIQGRKFLSKRTFLKAVQECLGSDNLDCYQRPLLKVANRRTGAPLLMEANRRGIDWYVSEVWQANRSFEMFLKRQKTSFSRICPLCHHEEPEYNYIPF